MCFVYCTFDFVCWQTCVCVSVCPYIHLNTHSRASTSSRMGTVLPAGPIRISLGILGGLVHPHILPHLPSCEPIIVLPRTRLLIRTITLWHDSRKHTRRTFFWTPCCSISTSNIFLQLQFEYFIF